MTDKYMEALDDTDVMLEFDRLRVTNKELEAKLVNMANEYNELMNSNSSLRAKLDSTLDEIGKKLVEAELELGVLTRKLTRAQECIRLLVAVSANLTTKD